MFHQIQTFVNEKIKHRDNKSNHNFYIYLGKHISDRILDINITKDKFLEILKLLSNNHMVKHSSFSKDKIYHINNKCYILTNNKIRSHSVDLSDYRMINNNICIIYQSEKKIPNKDFYSCNGYNHIEHRETIKLRYNFMDIYLNHIIKDNKNKESYNVYFKFNDKNFSESILNIIDIIKLI